MSRPRSALRRFFALRRPSALRRLENPGEEGFTLIELVIVLVILPLVMGAVAVVLITTLQDSAGVSTRISESVDSQITSAFYVRDVQSAQFVTTSATAAAPWAAVAGGSVCGSGPSTAIVVSLAWASGTTLGTGTTAETVVTYRKTAQAQGSGSVSGSTLTSTAPVFSSGDVGQPVVQTDGSLIPVGTTIKAVTSPTTATLSNPATSSGPVHFAVGPMLVRDFCKGASTPSSVTTSHDFFTPFLRAVVSCGTASSTCAHAGTTWVPAEGVTTVDLAVMEPSGHYDYNVSATPRVSNGSGPVAVPQGGGPPTTYTLPTLLLLGGVTRVIKEDSTANVTVTGSVSMNTGYFDMTHGSTFAATEVETTDTPVTKLCTTPPTAKCAGTITPPVATAVHITTPIPDRLAGLEKPLALPVRTCPSNGDAHTGVLTLTPGQYRCPISVTGQGNVHALKLNRGSYEFDTGITVGGSHNGTTVAFTGVTGVFIYLPCNTVDSWATRCGENFALKNSKIDVRALTTGLYAGMWFWQTKGDTAQVTLAGPGDFKMTGILYAARATVKLSGQSGTSAIGSVVASRLWVHNGTFVLKGT